MWLKALAPPTGVWEISRSEPKQLIFYFRMCKLSFCCLQPKGPDPNMQVVHNIYCYYYLTIIQHQQNIVKGIVQYKTYV